MYTVLIESDEEKSGAKGNPIITHKGEKYWPTVDTDGWIEASSVRCLDENQIPTGVLTFLTKEKAEAFGKRWKGHPWWVVPIGYEVVKLTPKFKQVSDGFTRG